MQRRKRFTFHKTVDISKKNDMEQENRVTDPCIVLYQSDIEGDRFDEATPTETLEEAKEIFRKILDREFLSADSPFTFPDEEAAKDRGARIDLIRNRFETEGDAETEFLVRDTVCTQRLAIVRIRKKCQ